MNCVSPRLHVDAWWPSGSRIESGQNAQLEPHDVSKPSHHLRATLYWFGSKWSPRPSDGTTKSQEEEWGAEMDNRRALSATEDLLNMP